MAPGEDADRIAANVLDVTLAGLKSGVELQPIVNAGCSLDESTTNNQEPTTNEEPTTNNEQRTTNNEHPRTRVTTCEEPSMTPLRTWVLLAGLPLVAAACSSGNAKTKDPVAAAPAAISVAPVAAVEQPVARFIRATGSLMAEEQADVAAETAGRVVAAPVERGTSVSQGSELVRLSSTETDAQLKEAQANAAQIEARLGLTPSGTFTVDAVPEVQNAKASYELAQSEFARIKSLLDQKVVSQSEYDQRRTQMEASRQQYEAAKNGALQQYQSLQAARARVALAHKAFNDTVVRAPFNGVVAERLVSVGDYVNKGTKVA